MAEIKLRMGDLVHAVGFPTGQSGTFPGWQGRKWAAVRHGGGSTFIVKGQTVTVRRASGDVTGVAR